MSLSVTAPPAQFAPHMTAQVSAAMKDGSHKEFGVVVKVATRSELRTLRAGGILAETLTDAVAAA